MYCTQNTGFFRRIFQFIKSLPSSVQTKLLRDIADENADERRRAVGHDLAPHRAVAVLERLQSPALLLLLFHHALDTGSQLADRGGQLVELAHIVLQQLNALILPTIFFLEPSAKLFVLGTSDGTVHLHSFPGCCPIASVKIPVDLVFVVLAGDFLVLLDGDFLLHHRIADHFLGPETGIVILLDAVKPVSHLRHLRIGHHADVVQLSRQCGVAGFQFLHLRH